MRKRHKNTSLRESPKGDRSNLLGARRLLRHSLRSLLAMTMLTICVLSVQAYADVKSYKSPIVRVAVIKDAKQLELSIKSAFKIMPLEMDEALHSDKLMKKSLVSPTKWGLKIADMDFKLYGVRIIPDADSAIHINNSIFRGEVDIVRQKDETLLVVNHINVEDYLRGVLYHEVSHWWPQATLQAQAIASRTFALYQARINKSKDYDLECSVISQVYGGVTSERLRTNEAVYKTIGKVITYKGKLLPAYFHATCAGHTEAASVLWKDDLEPLRGVVCNFCRQSPHYSWKKALPVADIEKAIGIEGIKNITPVKWSASGRVTLLSIETKYKNIEYSAKDFRQKLGGNVLRSAIFKIEIKNGLYGKPVAYINGAGWGHGVGMCQWGAFGAARNGYNAEKILKYYYPGADIEMYNGQ